MGNSQFTAQTRLLVRFLNVGVHQSVVKWMNGKQNLQTRNAADRGLRSRKVKDEVGSVVVVLDRGVGGCIDDMDMDSPATAGRIVTASARPVALITGASSGIGAAFAHVFARNGHEVVLTARRAPQMANVASSIRAAGYRAHTISCDLSRPDAAECIAREMAALNLEPSFIVNNAGYGLLGPAATLDRGEQLAMIDLNCRTLTRPGADGIPGARRHPGRALSARLRSLGGGRRARGLQGPDAKPRRRGSGPAQQAGAVAAAFPAAQLHRLDGLRAPAPLGRRITPPASC